MHTDAIHPGRLNRYIYCSNNPVSVIDPFGLDESEPSSSNSLVGSIIEYVERIIDIVSSTLSPSDDSNKDSNGITADDVIEEEGPGKNTNPLDVEDDGEGSDDSQDLHREPIPSEDDWLNAQNDDQANDYWNELEREAEMNYYYGPNYEEDLKWLEDQYFESLYWIGFEQSYPDSSPECQEAIDGYDYDYQ